MASSYLPVLLVSLATNAVPDDSSLVTLPRGQVDYLSHDWQEEDVWRSWRNMTRQKNEIANGARLENASWRTWWKQRNKLKTISPETLNWLKDSDVTWLYGPLHTAVEWTPPPKPVPVTDTLDSTATATARLGLSVRPRVHKPILKHRSISQLLTSDFHPPSSLFNTADSDEDNEDDHESPNATSASLPKRPTLPHTKSDTHITRWGPSRAFRRDSPPRIDPPGFEAPEGYFPPNPEPGGASSAAPHRKKHITFNTFVEQCIAIEKPKKNASGFFGPGPGQEWGVRTFVDDDGYDEDQEDSDEGEAWGAPAIRSDSDDEPSGATADAEAGPDNGTASASSDEENDGQEEDDDDVLEMRSTRSLSSSTRTLRPPAATSARSQSVSTASSSSSASTASTSASASSASSTTAASSPASSRSPARSGSRRKKSSATTDTNAAPDGQQRRHRRPAMRSRTPSAQHPHGHVTIAPIAPTLLKTGGAWAESLGDEGASDDGLGGFAFGGWGVGGSTGPLGGAYGLGGSSISGAGIGGNGNGSGPEEEEYAWNEGRARKRRSDKDKDKDRARGRASAGVSADRGRGVGDEEASDGTPVELVYAPPPPRYGYAAYDVGGGVYGGSSTYAGAGGGVADGGMYPGSGAYGGYGYGARTSSFGYDPHAHLPSPSHASPTQTYTPSPGGYFADVYSTADGGMSDGAGFGYAPGGYGVYAGFGRTVIGGVQNAADANAINTSSTTNANTASVRSRYTHADGSLLRRPPAAEDDEAEEERVEVVGAAPVDVVPTPRVGLGIEGAGMARSMGGGMGMGMGGSIARSVEEEDALDFFGADYFYARRGGRAFGGPEENAAPRQASQAQVPAQVPHAHAQSLSPPPLHHRSSRRGRGSERDSQPAGDERPSRSRSRSHSRTPSPAILAPHTPASASSASAVAAPPPIGRSLSGGYGTTNPSTTTVPTAASIKALLHGGVPVTAPPSGRRRSASASAPSGPASWMSAAAALPPPTHLPPPLVLPPPVPSPYASPASVLGQGRPSSRAEQQPSRGRTIPSVDRNEQRPERAPQERRGRSSTRTPSLGALGSASSASPMGGLSPDAGRASPGSVASSISSGVGSGVVSVGGVGGGVSGGAGIEAVLGGAVALAGGRERDSERERERERGRERRGRDRTSGKVLGASLAAVPPPTSVVLPTSPQTSSQEQPQETLAVSSPQPRPPSPQEVQQTREQQHQQAALQQLQRAREQAPSQRSSSVNSCGSSNAGGVGVSSESSSATITRARAGTPSASSVACSEDSVERSVSQYSQTQTMRSDDDDDAAFEADVLAAHDGGAEAEARHLRRAEEEQRRRVHPTPSNSPVVAVRRMAPAGVGISGGGVVVEKDVEDSTTSSSSGDTPPGASTPATSVGSVPSTAAPGSSIAYSAPSTASATPRARTPSADGAKLRPPPLISPPAAPAKPSTSFTAVSSPRAAVGAPLNSGSASSGLGSAGSERGAGEPTMVTKAVDMVSSAYMRLWGRDEA